jgi:hypothetical protein
VIPALENMVQASHRLRQTVGSDTVATRSNAAGD